jgi:serine/threonine-protein kinase RsbW
MQKNDDASCVFPSVFLLMDDPAVTPALGILHRFPADMAALPAILAHLQAHCPASAAALVQKAATALEELFTNSVCHGLQDEDPSAAIGLAVGEEGEKLHLRYEDCLRPFDPFAGLDVIEEQAAMPLQDRPVGGLGRLIVHGLADQARYTRVGDTNRIDLSFSLNSGG